LIFIDWILRAVWVNILFDEAGTATIPFRTHSGKDPAGNVSSAEFIDEESV